MSDPIPPLRVVKLGGSLLWQPETTSRLQKWIRQQPLRRQLWIVGGGQLVDGIRKFDKTNGLSPLAAHQLSIQLMDVTADLLASQFPDWPVIDHSPPLNDVPLFPQALNTILRPSRWMQQQNLPPSWDVTSDSIAAQAAIDFGAAELVLLKACRIPSGPIPNWVSLNLVDRWFDQVDLSGVEVSGVELPAI